MEKIDTHSEVVQKTLRILEDKAKQKQLVNYGELYPKIGLSTEDPEDRNTGAAILSEVNIITIQEKNIMLSSLVTLREKQYPAQGFFEFAVEQKRMTPTNDEMKLLAFWANEVSKAFKAYD